ncbi:MAG: formylglycine-generating enzyme family protein, partial [Chloroflexota bacterium]|nr:formylglycine-generating enzyme family protein [Chloroflexota bacterium]
RLFGPRISREVSAIVEVQKPPHLALKLAPDSDTVELGKPVSWNLKMFNDGGMDLNQVMARHGRTLLDDPFDLSIGAERQFDFNKTYRHVGAPTEKVTVTAMTDAGVRLRWVAEAQVKVGYKKLTLTKPVEMELIRIPAGEFLMGSDENVDKHANINEQLQHRLHLPEYYIGKYPVTVAQIRPFVEKSGHKFEDYSGSLKGKPNHPVVRVSFKKAVAFCEWLSRESGQVFRLPSEAEWEKAARGTDGLIYPWGSEWDPKRCNSEEGGVGDITHVGKYSPQGDSPYGCTDMAGNVWEWTRSLYRDYPYDPDDGREATDVGDSPRVVRGSSWIDNHGYARCAYRYRHFPRWSDLYGFRVVVSTALRPR